MSRALRRIWYAARRIRVIRSALSTVPAAFATAGLVDALMLKISFVRFPSGEDAEHEDRAQADEGQQPLGHRVDLEGAAHGEAQQRLEDPEGVVGDVPAEGGPGRGGQPDQHRV